MKFSLLAVNLSLASATSIRAAKKEQDVIADKQQEQHRSLDVKIYIESMGTADEYTYDSDLMCQPSFCQDFSDKCSLSGGQVESFAFASFSSTYCRVFLDDGAEITCTEKCDVPGPPPSPSNNLPTGEFQIKDLLFSGGYCLEVQTDATTGLPSDESDVFETFCDGSPAQKWTQRPAFYENGSFPVFTLSPSLDANLCMDMERRTGRNMHVYSCKDENSFNQEFDTAFFEMTGGKLKTMEEICVDVSDNGGDDGFPVSGNEYLKEVQCANSDDIPTFSFELAAL